MSDYNRLVSSSFHLPSGVLFSFRSRYYYTIGLETYLGLEVHASHIHAQFPMHATLGTRQSPFRLPFTGLSPSMAPLSSELQVGRLRCNRTQTPHLPHVSMRDSVCPVPLSIAFNYGISSISLPAGTKMLQFPAFPILTDFALSKGGPIQQSLDQRFLAPPQRISQLGTTFLSAQTRLSSKRRS